jgi:hypothetical protein
MVTAPEPMHTDPSSRRCDHKRNENRPMR